MEKQWRSRLASFWSTFFIHFYEISRPSVFFPSSFSSFFPSVLSCSVLIITHFVFVMLRRGGHSGEIGGSKRMSAGVRGGGRREDTSWLVGPRGSRQNRIATCVRGAWRGEVAAEADRRTSKLACCEVRMTGRSTLVLVPRAAVSWRWSRAPLEKALVVEKGMNRESDEREISWFCPYSCTIE